MQVGTVGMWLKPINNNFDKEMIQSFIQPYPAEELEAWPVRQLKGKNGVGNNELAKEKFEYSELNEEII